ncbi:MAG: S41 family peptidase [Chloroflexi bacterium]|nr:MAG: S41 family peptidase [Chloroflexota bacterium]
MRRQFIRILLTGILLLLVVVAAFGGGVYAARMGLLPGTETVQAADQPPEFAVFWQVWGLVQRYFVDREALDPTQMTYGAIRGLIDSLGDEGHTRFLTPDEARRQQTDITGSFFGIGATVGIRDGLPVIVSPFDGSPADQAGLKPGDIIIEVDGEDVTTLPLNDVVDRIRGEEGTEVVLTIFRPDTNQSLDISIIRAEIKIPATDWAMVPGTDVALIRMIQFNGNLKDELVADIQEARNAGASALIVDVRNNPGGLLEQAIEVTSQFLSEGNVLLQEDAQGNRETYPVKPGGVATDIPLVVLVNGGSASAAEIFAGAIQDHQRGPVVGETTFGTGTVLQPFELDDGSVLLLGTSQWLTPNGRLIRKNGIEPDVLVDLPAGADLLSPGEVKEMTLDEIAASEDAQLLKALELLGVEIGN